MDINQEALKLHSENRGKIEVVSKTKSKICTTLHSLYPRSSRTPPQNPSECCRCLHLHC